MKFETRNLKCVFLTLLLSAGVVFGEATMKIQPPLIQLSESATLSIEVRDAKRPQPPALPNVPGLRFAYNGQSTQHSWVNGKSDSFTSFNYQVYPQRTGTFSIGPFNYTVGGKTQTLQGELKVVGSSSEAQQPQSWSDLLFAKMTADRDSAYVQEPFTLTLSIYSRQGVQLAGNIGLNGMPQSGLPDLQWQEGQPGREVINGSIFEVRHFTARTRAMSSGRFDFSPAVTVQVATQNQQRNRDPFFGSMFQRTQTRPVDLAVEPVTVDVRPLPEVNRPDGFNGAVGRFRFKTSASPLSVQVGDPITLQLQVAGDGNFDRVMMPELQLDDSFRLFGDPVRKQTDQGVIFEQAISPRTAEIKQIPSVPFSFFDTEAGQYRTVRSTPIPISVTSSSNNSAQVFAAQNSVVLPPPSQDHTFATESDVQRIESALTSMWKTIRPWLWTLPTALIIGLILFFGRKVFHARKRDTARVRRQKAPKAARKALRVAEQARRKGEASKFYDALWDALTGYFGHRLNLPPGDITASRVLHELDFDPAQQEDLKALFQKVEVARYGITIEATSDGMEELQQSLEDHLKRWKKHKQ